MTLAHTHDLVAAAVARSSAVPAFNVITLEHAEAIIEGAESSGVAVLLQVSENAIRYHQAAREPNGGFAPLLAACRELASASSIGVGLHLDHIESLELADRCLERADELGIGSIMFDGSTLAYAANVEITAAFTERAHARGVWVEAELGAIGGKDGAHTPGVRTDPDEARDFALATGVDALAVAVGSSHAMTEQTGSLDLDLISALAARVEIPLVLHGSSGVPHAQLAQAVAAGIRKVNVGTALNVAWTTAVRAALADQPTAVDPRRYFAGARDEMAAVVSRLCSVIARGEG